MTPWIKMGHCTHCTAFPAHFVTSSLHCFERIGGAHRGISSANTPRRNNHGGRCRNRDASLSRRVKENRCILAGLQLFIGGHDLSSRQSPAARKVEAGTY